MFSWCYDSRSLAALYLGFAACGAPQGELQPCDPDPQTWPGLPQITAISPTSGPPGTVVTLSGVNFNQIDTRFRAAYANYANSCEHSTMDGDIISDSEMQVVIPDGASLSGYIYLEAEGLTVTRTPQHFELEGAAYITVHNQSQFPIVSAEASWTALLEPGERIDVQDDHVFQVPAGPMHLVLCTGAPLDSGELETWACVTHDGTLSANQRTEVTVSPLPAASFLMGDWVATWDVGEEEPAEEQLRIDRDGYWEIRYDSRVVESGNVIDTAWPAYSTTFSFGLREDEPLSEATVPVRSFSALSPRAGDRVAFYRAE